MVAITPIETILKKIKYDIRSLDDVEINILPNIIIQVIINPLNIEILEYKYQVSKSTSLCGQIGVLLAILFKPTPI